jgi:DNA-binding NarL/FixJ family response regulator
MPKSVLIVDDHPIVRQGLRQIISEIPGVVTIDESENGQDALNKISATSYDLVLLDISLPIMSGLEVLSRINKDEISKRVIMLSIHDEEQFAIRALKLGAMGYLTKKSAPNELVTAIGEVLHGNKYICHSVAQKMALYISSNAEKPKHEELSEREYSVLCMLAAGKSIKDIAASLFLSPKTVSTYRARIMKKMNLKSNSDLTHYAIKHRLIE